NLVFYTPTPPLSSKADLPERGVNTDAWSAAAGVDFPAADLPTRPPAPPNNKPIPSVEPGYERFNFRVDTGGRTVNLLQDRVSAATEAQIQNITLVRRKLVKFTGTIPPNSEYKLLPPFLATRDGYAGAIGEGVRSVADLLAKSDFDGAAKAIEKLWDT